MKYLLQTLASWYWGRMRCAERQTLLQREAIKHGRIYSGPPGTLFTRKAMRLKNVAETLERWARWWG